MFRPEEATSLFFCAYPSVLCALFTLKVISHEPHFQSIFKALDGSGEKITGNPSLFKLSVCKRLLLEELQQIIFFPSPLKAHRDNPVPK